MGLLRILLDPQEPPVLECFHVCWLGLPLVGPAHEGSSRTGRGYEGLNCSRVSRHSNIAVVGVSGFVGSAPPKAQSCCIIKSAEVLALAV